VVGFESTYEAAACAAGSYASIALTPASQFALRALRCPRGWTRSHCNRWACGVYRLNDCTVELDRTKC
jgi:hypothetical protein